MKALVQESPHEELFGFQLNIINIIGGKNIYKKKVLDIGSGFGWFEKQSLFYNVGHITGLELEQESINIAQQLQDKKVTFIQGSALKLPFKKNHFDTVVSWEVLEHIPKHTEPTMMQEVYRVLKPGGSFCFSTQHANILSTLLDPAWWIAGHRHYSVRTLVQFILDAGFHIEKCYLRGGIHNAIHPINLYVSKWVFKRKPFFKDYFYSKLTEEFSKQNGFTNAIFVCKK